MQSKSFYSRLSGRQIFILSPHFDDAVLSCGQLLHDLRHRADITVINIFTQAHGGPYTFSAQKNLLNSGGYKNALDLYNQRQTEDNNVLSSLGIKIINLGFTDSIFRRRKKSSWLSHIIPEINHLYPTYRWHVLNRVSFHDPVLDQIQHRLETIAPNQAVVLIPSNVAGHVDHLITRKAGEFLFSDIIYYLEFPYISKKPPKFSLRDFCYQKLLVKQNIKNNLITRYSTQIQNLFPNGQIPKHHETYYWRRPNRLYTKIYQQLSPQLFTLWQTLWQTSNQATHVNSPLWFQSASQSYKFSDIKLITVYQGSKLVAIAPLIKTGLFGLSVYSPPAQEYAGALPFLYDVQYPHSLDHLIQAFLKLGTVTFNYLPDKIFQSLSRATNLFSMQPTALNRYLNLQSDSQNRTYHHLEKKLSQSIKAQLDQFVLSVHSGLDTQALDIAFKIDQASVKRTRGYNTFFSLHAQSFYQLLAQKFGQQFNTFILTFNQQPVAYILGFSVNGIFYASQMAYLPQFGAYSPGKKLFHDLIKYLSLQHYNILDFGTGDNQLKRSITPDYTQLNGVYLSQNGIVRYYLLFIGKLRSLLFDTISRHRRLYSIYRRVKNHYV